WHGPLTRDPFSSGLPPHRAEHLPALDGDADLAPVVAGLEAHAGRLAVHDGAHVADVDRGFLGDDPALRVDPRGLEVLGPQVDPLDDNAVLVGNDPEDLADLPAAGAGGDDHGVAFPHVLGHGQTTSEARDTIFM